MPADQLPLHIIQQHLNVLNTLIQGSIVKLYEIMTKLKNLTVKIWSYGT